MNEYLTRDLHEAAFLCATKQVLLRLEDEGKFYSFVFSNKQSCKSLSDDFWFGKATINAKVFVDALNFLKDLLFSQRNKKDLTNA
ncbi:MAG: hypothetical protein ABIH50_00100 [bacterium]